MLLRRRCSRRHRAGAVEVETGIVEHLLQAMPGMEAFETEAPALAIESEDAAIGDEGDRPARPIDARRAGPGRADEIDLRHQRAARMFQAKEDDSRHDVIEIGGAEGARETHFRLSVIADRDEVDIGAAVDLSAREKEGVDAALAAAIEELASAIGKEVVPLARQQRDEGPPAPEMAREQRGGRRDRRGRTDGDMPDLAEQPQDHRGEELLVAEASVRHRLCRLAREDMALEITLEPVRGRSQAGGFREMRPGANPSRLCPRG